ncbi:MAG: tetratricopeptide repeat protein [Bacteroidetes bacterium]|nr:MAG: tetratricopeptide repeat protein [Bacteroidota bacterium]
MDTQTSLAQLLSSANTFFSSGLYEDALESYQKALLLDPANGDIHLGVAASHLKLKQIGDGLVALEKAMKLAPAEDKARLRRGGAKLLAEAGAFAEAQIQLAPLLREAPTAEDLMNSVRYQAEAGATPEALALLERVLPQQPNLWDDILADPALSPPAKQALLDGQERLLPLVREGIDPQKKAALDQQVAYLRQHSSGGQEEGSVAAWEGALQTLVSTTSLSEAIAVRKNMSALAGGVSQALLDLLREEYAPELQQVAGLADHARYTTATLPEGAAKASAEDFLAQVAANAEALRTPTAAIAAHEELNLLLSQGAAELPAWREALIDYAGRQAEGINLLKGQAIARELQQRFPDEVAVQALVGRVGARKEELKGKALTYGKWAGIAAGGALVLVLLIWGIVSIWPERKDRGNADTPPPAAQAAEAAESGRIVVEKERLLAPMVGAVVDQLKVRKEPHMEADLVSGMREGDVAYLIGEGGEPTTVELRGQEITARWSHIRLLNGQEGWSFSGGLMGMEAPSALPRGYRFPDGSRFEDAGFPFYTEGDFDGNGMKDCAWILEKNGSGWELFLFLNQGNGQYVSKAVGGYRASLRSPGCLSTMKDPYRGIVKTEGRETKLCLYRHNGNVRDIREFQPAHDFVAFGIMEVGQMEPFYYEPGSNRVVSYGWCY